MANAIQIVVPGGSDTIQKSKYRQKFGSSSSLYTWTSKRSRGYITSGSGLLTSKFQSNRLDKRAGALISFSESLISVRL